MLRRLMPLFTVGLLIGTLGACSDEPDDAEDRDAAAGPPLPSVTVPAARLTPFCEAMIELADELERDPPDDTAAVILETYLGIVDDVPPAIDNEFRAVIAELQSGGAASTTSTTTNTAADDPASSTSVPPDTENFDAEGRLPGDTPSERVNDYVLFTCRGSENNPGPPATEPLTATTDG